MSKPSHTEIFTHFISRPSKTKLLSRETSRDRKSRAQLQVGQAGPCALPHCVVLPAHVRITYMCFVKVANHLSASDPLQATPKRLPRRPVVQHRPVHPPRSTHRGDTVGGSLCLLPPPWVSPPPLHGRLQQLGGAAGLLGSPH